MSIPNLPNEPRIINPEQQALLTQRFLAPNVEQLFCLFTALRKQLDAPLQAKQPLKLGKPYPLGQCLEISQAFECALKELDASTFSTPEHLTAFRAIQAFMTAGGEFRQVWGDLRGQYFQNAFILGSWYLDVANDTVDANKPPVEILPFSESGLRPIQNFAHFAVIAKRYWQAVCLPNLIYPELAPFFPLIVLQPNAAPQLHGMFDYMIALTMRSGFAMSEEAIRELPFPEHLFQAMLPNQTYELETARVCALRACREARTQGLHQSASARNTAIQNALKANHALQSLSVQF